MTLPKKLYCICGTPYEATEHDDKYILVCPFCGRNDEIKREQKIIELTVNKDAKMKETMDSKIDKIHSDIDDLLWASKFKEIDDIIASIDIPSLSTSELIAYASATYWPNKTNNKPNDRLKNRKSMMEKIEKELKSRPDWDKMHLYGLEGE